MGLIDVKGCYLPWFKLIAKSYTAIKLRKKLPFLLERVGVTTCMDAGGRATQEQLPRRIKK